MRIPLLRILLSLSILVILGAGCSRVQEETEQPPVTNNETVVPSTQEQQAYAWCVYNGNSFDIITTDQGYVFDCVLTDARRCDALAFLSGDCGIDTALALSTPTTSANAEDVYDAPRFCEPIANPICGTNGRTYSNECIAAQQQVTVAHIGTCSIGQEPTNPPIVPEPSRPGSQTGSSQQQSNNESQNNSNTPPPTVPDYSAPEPIYTEQGIPDWVAVPFSLLKDNPSVQSASVARCRVAGNTYYLQIENCPNCFSTLYRADGTLMCNPSNDLNNSCPAGFDEDSSPSSCTVILKK